jgi:hypothetical protein
VISENLDPFDPKDVVLAITSSSEGVSETNTTTVKLQAACQLDLSSFVGTYTAEKSTGSVYNVEVTLGPVANTLNIENLDERGGNTVIELNTDVTNPTIIYRSEEFNAYTYIHAAYGEVWATTLTPEASSYNSCDNSMSLEFRRCVSIGCFGGTRQIELTKQ